MRPEDHERHQPKPDEHELHLPHLIGAKDARCDVASHDSVVQCLPDEHEEEPEDHRAHDWPEHSCGTAEDEHGVGEEGECRRVVVWLHRLRGDREDDAREGSDDATEGQGLHLVQVHVLSEAAHSILVLADRLEDPTPRGAHEEPGEKHDDPDENPAVEHDPEVIAAELDDGCIDARREWVEGVPVGGVLAGDAV